MLKFLKKSKKLNRTEGKRIIYMRKAVDGLVNKYTFVNVRREGDESHDIDYIAHQVAKERIIKKAFDEMIEDEIQIDNYIL